MWIKINFFVSKITCWNRWEYWCRDWQNDKTNARNNTKRSKQCFHQLPIWLLHNLFMILYQTLNQCLAIWKSTYVVGARGIEKKYHDWYMIGWEYRQTNVPQANNCPSWTWMASILVIKNKKNNLQIDKFTQTVQLHITCGLETHITLCSCEINTDAENAGHEAVKMLHNAFKVGFWNFDV